MNNESVSSKTNRGAHTTRHTELICIDENTYTLKCGQKSVSLSNKEMQILLLLIKNEGNMVSQEMITNAAWEVDAYSTSENVWVFISYIRKKLDSIGSSVKIKSIRYQGYYLEK